MPLGMWRNGTSLPSGFLPSGASYLNGAWSDENTVNRPSAMPFQMTSWFDLSRGGGLHTHLAPL